MSFVFEYLRQGRDTELPRLIFKSIGFVSGLLVKNRQLDVSVIRSFLEQVKQLERIDSSICLVLTIHTSKPMFLAHCFASFFRGYISHCEDVSDKTIAYFLVECLVRALLDKSEFKTDDTAKFYAQVSTCRISLRS